MAIRRPLVNDAPTVVIGAARCDTLAVTWRGHRAAPTPDEEHPRDPMEEVVRGRLLLTGASGFVGSHVLPSLLAAGWQVRCLTRDLAKARRNAPTLDWVAGDVADEATLTRALAGSDAAMYLVHGMGEGGDYREKEVSGARNFARAAERGGVGRIVYLGGVAPVRGGSEHLRSRLDVGDALREGPVPVLELRASMIVGHGSLSWLIVRDLAARLPLMVLPTWMESRTEPVAIADVVLALTRALTLPLDGSDSFDLPGPEALSGKEIVARTAQVMGLSPPHSLEVPLLTPRLSSLWVRFVTRAKWSVAREIVVGLTQDLLARDDRFWHLIDHPHRQTMIEAARSALRDESAIPVGGFWGLVERARGIEAPTA